MDNTERYICNFGLGWGVAGATMSGINLRLRNLDLTNDAPISFPKISSLIIMKTIDVTGDKTKVAELRDYMIMIGLDKRSYDHQ